MTSDTVDHDLITLLTEGPIVVLAPHPDDETLGCGALLTQAFARFGARVVCLTDGSASHPGSRDWPAPRLAEQRRRELIRAVQILGGRERDVTWMGYRDSALSEADVPGAAARIAAIVAAENAVALFAPAAEDHHADHKAAARIAAAAARLRPGLPFFSYPLWSRWDDPSFADLAAAKGALHFSCPSARARKRAAIQAHASQLGGLITDDPGGFALEPGMVEAFVTGDEIYWSQTP